MDFRYGTAFAAPPPEAYERLLLDVLLGDPSLYTRTDAVEAAWKFVDPILKAWEATGRPEALRVPRRHLGSPRGRQADGGDGDAVAAALNPNDVFDSPAS